jgi:putative transposase
MSQYTALSYARGFDRQVQSPAMSHRSALHRRLSLRLRGFDYRSRGAYFITIVAQGRRCLLGEVRGDAMCLNPAGAMIHAKWFALPSRFPLLEPDAFVLMPNHVHGILVLTDTMGEGVGEHKVRPYDQLHRSGTTAESIGRMIQAFKSETTFAYTQGVRSLGWEAFEGRLWQRNYYDHIIRDEADLARIHEYIETNPLRWTYDQLHPCNAS